jgi:hypothetical protein
MNDERDKQPSAEQPRQAAQPGSAQELDDRELDKVTGGVVNSGILQPPQPPGSFGLH